MPATPDERIFLSRTQQALLVLIPIPSSILSIIGSSLIIVLVSRESAKPRSSPYKRIMVALSAVDIIATMAVVAQGFGTPGNRGDRIWSIGNSRTCSLLGLIQEFAVSALFYNAMLAMYYCFTIRLGRAGEHIVAKHEVWMHTVSIGYPLIAGIVGSILGLFDESAFGTACHIVDTPVSDCSAKDEKCISLVSLVVAHCLFWGLPLVCGFTVIAASMIAIFLHVSRTTRQLSERSLTRFRNSLPNVSRDEELDSEAQRKIRTVAAQSVLYVAGFSITYIFPSAVLLVEFLYRPDEPEFFWLLVLRGIFLPSLGIWNALIFMRPRYIAWRQLEPEKGRLWAISCVFKRELRDGQKAPSSRMLVAGRSPKESSTRSKVDARFLPSTNNPELPISGRQEQIAS